ncbi:MULTISPECIES: PEPxxWA-CTERM sorting domain-containing protein [Phenylobacterium]|uniref:ABC-type glycerol-3-phosphate transport system substrate-binding protein n=1 Tax=Phenylobacterium koreense TaxID=266125 RepID=A0ABV2EEE8_9CAUL
MKIALKAAAFAAVAALAATAGGSAQAAVNVTFTSTDAGLPAGQQMVWDFDGVEGAGYGVSFTAGSGPRAVAAGSSSDAAPPPGATGFYAAVLGGGEMLLTTPGIAALSFFMGSPDNYNSIRFNYSDGSFDTLTGIELAAGAFNGDQSIGRRMTYQFEKSVTSVLFSSSQNSFEFDNIATLSSAVPEPATWAMLIAGFGLAGSAIRSRRQKAALALA